MRELDLLEAESVGAAEGEAGTSWWKWLLGLAAAAGITYFVVKDLAPEALLSPNPLLRGRRPW